MYSFTRRVAISECGPDKKMSVHGVLSALSDCEQFQNDSLAVISDYCTQHRIAAFVAYRQADIHRLPEYGETITVSSHIYELASFLGRRNTLIETTGGERLVSSYGLGVFVGAGTGKPSRLTDPVIKSFTLDTKDAMEVLPRKIPLPDLPFSAAGGITVTPRYIDFNRHMNNVHYVTVAFDAISEPFEIGRIRVDYKTAAAERDLVRPLVYAPDGNSRTVVLAGSGDTVYAVAEFCRK